MAKSPKANQEIRLDYIDERDRIAAAQLIAELVRQGVTFESFTENVSEKTKSLELVIQFTGGY